MTAENEPDHPIRGQDALDRVSDGIIGLDTDFRYTYLNDRAVEILGRDREALLGEVVWDAFPAVKGAETERLLRTARDTGEEQRVEQYIAALDAWYDVAIYPESDGLSVYLTDITGRKRSEADREEAEQRLTALLENVTEAVYIKDREGRYQLMSEAGAALFDRGPEEVVGLTDADLFDEESVAEISEVDEEILATGRPQTDENVRYIDGEQHVFLDHKFPYRNAEGAVVGIMGISPDITERVSFQRRLRRLQEAVRQLNGAQTAEGIASLALEAAVDILEFPVAAVWLYDDECEELVPVAESDAAQAAVGPAPSFRPGNSLAWEVFETGEYRAFDDVSTVDGAYNEDSPLGAEVMVPLGGHGVMSIAATETGVFSDHDVELFRILGGAAREALVRAEREAELRTLTEEYEALLQHAEDAIFLIDVEWTDGEPTFRYERLSPSHEEISGMRTDGVQGQTPREALGESMGAAVEENYRRCLNAGEPIRYEEVIEMPDGEVTWQTNLAPVAVDGEVNRIVGIARDLTDRVEQERALRRKNERLDEFAGVISHDLRNPLNVAQGRLTLLEDDVDSEHLEPIRTALDRMVAIVEDTLTLAREGRHVSETTTVRIRDIVGQCWGVVETGDATLAIPEGFAIQADRNRLRHVFENLVRNAVEHAGPDVTVRIERLEDGFAVEDDGPGIPADDHESVFEPGHTTAQDGTGFGLTIVKRIAEAHDWTVVLADGADGGLRIEFHGVAVEDSARAS